MRSLEWQLKTCGIIFGSLRFDFGAMWGALEVHLGTLWGHFGALGRALGGHDPEGAHKEARRGHLVDFVEILFGPNVHLSKENVTFLQWPTFCTFFFVRAFPIDARIDATTVPMCVLTNIYIFFAHLLFLACRIFHKFFEMYVFSPLRL